MEEGRVEYVPVNVPSLSNPGPRNLRVSSEESKKRNLSRSPVKRRFEIASPPSFPQRHGVVEYLGFSAALDRQQACRKSRRSGRNCFPRGRTLSALAVFSDRDCVHS